MSSLCYFCPNCICPSSQRPVKRYKSILRGIFPKSPGEEPNEKKIGKLCGYISKNPHRVEKITKILDRKCYNALRNENFYIASAVLCIYRRVLLSSREQMPRFADNLLNIIQTLLDQTRNDEMRILGCHTLFEFINSQTDGTHMVIIENFIPKLCDLALELGNENRVCSLRCAGLQTLSSMVWFMGEHSHISEEFDNVVSAILENHERQSKEAKDSADSTSTEYVRCPSVHKMITLASSSLGAMSRIPSWNRIINKKGELNLTLEETKNPSFWSRVCINNMAKLAKEATTIRRVIDSIFRYFDHENLWSSQYGPSLSVLYDIQVAMEKYGQNTHLLLSILIKHLDHKSVSKHPNIQLGIVEVITCLAYLSKDQPSFSTTSAISDLIKHLRKIMQNSHNNETLEAEVIYWNNIYQSAVDSCLVQLSSKIDNAGPVLDMLAVLLENLSTTVSVARSTISAVYRTAQIIAAVPNLSYMNKAFPEALFYQLLLAMVHPDHETRVGSHRIFSVVLVPSSVCPRDKSITLEPTKRYDLIRTLSRTVSVFSSSTAIFNKLKWEKHNNVRDQKCSNEGGLKKLHSSQSRIFSMKYNVFSASTDTDAISNSSKVMDLRLSTRQITLLFSSIWVQATSPMNTPENYEAVSHTYSLALLFSQVKSSVIDVLIRSFQLAFSLRDISLKEDSLPPSRRRSLFTLATSMIVISSKAFNILPLILSVKESLNEKTIDPYLQLVDDCRLQVVSKSANNTIKAYGSIEDDEAALKSLSCIVLSEGQSKNAMLSVIVKNLQALSELEMNDVKKKLEKVFLPDDICPLGVPRMPMSPYGSGKKASSNLFPMGEDFSIEVFEELEVNNEHSTETNILNADNIVNSILEPGQHDPRRPSVSTVSEVSFSEMANHCEALLKGKRKKLSVLVSIKQNQEMLLTDPIIDENETNVPSYAQTVQTQKPRNPFLDHHNSMLKQYDNPSSCGIENQNNSQIFTLPTSNPYDSFLKAAGW